MIHSHVLLFCVLGTLFALHPIAFGDEKPDACRLRYFVVIPCDILVAIAFLYETFTGFRELSAL